VPEDLLPQESSETAESSAVLQKAAHILGQHKLEITREWLNRLIGRIDDVEALERFPTQESVRTSLELIQGLADCLAARQSISQFERGGMYYKQAAALGLLQREGGSLGALAESLDALEEAIWDQVAQGLRQQDREVLRLVKVLRAGLRRIMTSAAEAFHEQSSAELDRLAHTDILTGLHNRRYLEQELERHVELYRRYKRPFALLMLDFDNLKWLNDTFGHAAGDAALKHLASLMRSNIRDVDIPCRFGGDEFVILMPEADKNSIRAVGRRIAESLSRTRLKPGDSLIDLGISFGTSACPADGTDSELLLQQADAELYAAKERKSARSTSAVPGGGF
jgi:diguanylate cyclase (GGDEF)-like protein